MTLSAARSTPERPARVPKPTALFELPSWSTSAKSGGSGKSGASDTSSASGDPGGSGRTARAAKAAKSDKPAKAVRQIKSVKPVKPVKQSNADSPAEPGRSARPPRSARSSRSGADPLATTVATTSIAAATSSDLSAARQPTSGSVIRKASLIVVVSAALFVLAYLVAVRTPIGQRFEDAVWTGSGETAAQRPVQASDALSRIDDWSGGAAVAAVFLIGLARRRIALALTGVAVVGASIVTAELIKDRLPRPDLVPGAFNAGNSFPSGHTSVAMALMFALILVVPYRIRGLVAFCSAAAATGIGALTIVARWHRPSDTLGADLIVLAYASLAVLILAAMGHVRPASLRYSGTKAVRSIFVLGPIVLGTFVALCGAAVFAVLTFYHPGQLAHVSSGNRAAFIAGCLLALAGSGLVTLALLWLLRQLDLVPPLARRGAAAQDGR